jgi:hypothetical protein
MNGSEKKRLRTSEIMEQNFGQRMAQVAKKAQEEKLFASILQDVEKAANLGQTSVIRELPDQDPEHFENVKLRLQNEGLFVSLRGSSLTGCCIEVVLPHVSQAQAQAQPNNVVIKESSILHDAKSDEHKKRSNHPKKSPLNDRKSNDDHKKRSNHFKKRPRTGDCDDLLMKGELNWAPHHHEQEKKEALKVYNVPVPIPISVNDDPKEEVKKQLSPFFIPPIQELIIGYAEEAHVCCSYTTREKYLKRLFINQHGDLIAQTSYMRIQPKLSAMNPEVTNFWVLNVPEKAWEDSTSWSWPEYFIANELLLLECMATEQLMYGRNSPMAIQRGTVQSSQDGLHHVVIKEPQGTVFCPKYGVDWWFRSFPRSDYQIKSWDWIDKTSINAKLIVCFPPVPNSEKFILLVECAGETHNGDSRNLSLLIRRVNMEMDTNVEPEIIQVCTIKCKPEVKCVLEISSAVYTSAALVIGIMARYPEYNQLCLVRLVLK